MRPSASNPPAQLPNGVLPTSFRRSPSAFTPPHLQQPRSLPSSAPPPRTVLSTGYADMYPDLWPEDRMFRFNAQRLAQQILGKRRRDDEDDGDDGFLPAKRQRDFIPQLHYDRLKRETRVISRPAFRRCYDWVVHNGDVHYARNSSSFSTYTQINTTVSCLPGLGKASLLRAIGIGTVRLLARRNLATNDTCTIILNDVLHIPNMPCNGISISTLTDAGTDVCLSRDGLIVMQEGSGELLFCGPTRHKLFKVALQGNPTGDSPLEELGGPMAVSVCATDPAEVQRLGNAGRQMYGLQLRPGFSSRGADCEIEF